VNGSASLSFYLDISHLRHLWQVQYLPSRTNEEFVPFLIAAKSRIVSPRCKILDWLLSTPVTWGFTEPNSVRSGIPDENHGRQVNIPPRTRHGATVTSASAVSCEFQIHVGGHKLTPTARFNGFAISMQQICPTQASPYSSGLCVQPISTSSHS